MAGSVWLGSLVHAVQVQCTPAGVPRKDYLELKPSFFLWVGS
jgi:hypothetical protein